MTFARIVVRVSDDRTAFAVLASDGLDPRPIASALERFCDGANAKLKNAAANFADGEEEPFVMRPAWIVRVPAPLSPSDAEQMRDQIASAVTGAIASALGAGQ